MKKMNIGIFAHADAGKTTITEQLLFKSGATRQLGKVDDGTSVSDSMAVERRRGISVKASCVEFTHNDYKINIIDTPGHMDFSGEAQRALLAPDGAVLVISAVEGIQSHTRILWQELKKKRIPTLFVINKLDRVGSDYASVISEINSEFTDRVFLFDRCRNEGQNGEPLIIEDVLSEENSSAAEDLLLCADDDELTEKYFEGKAQTEQIIEKFLKKSKKAECFGAVLTGAKDGFGIDGLVKRMLYCLPDSSYYEAKELCGTVFKIEHDKTMGAAAYIRLFSGELNNRDTVFSGGKELGKISQIRIPCVGKFIDSGVLRAGEIGVIYGLADIKCGDTVGTDLYGRKIDGSESLMMVSVSAVNSEDKPHLRTALLQLEREEPLLQFKYSTVTGEMYINISGVIQLEILGEIIPSRYGIEVSFSQPQIIFKETPFCMGVGFESYTMPKPCWAKVELTVAPLPRGSGVRFKSVIKDNVLPYRYQHHVELSVMRDCISQGIFGWEVTDAEFTLSFGEYHSIHTHPLDFFVATPVAFLRALGNADTRLLEPIVKVSLSAPEENLGTVLGQITGMRGDFDSPEIQNGFFRLTAYLPVKESVFYPSRFSSTTSGKGTYSSEFYEYRECPRELYTTLARIGVDPLDRAKWILYCRSALGKEEQH